jgi:hypothetical protein
MAEYTFSEEEFDKIENLLIDALLIDGAHHKQWYIEQVLICLGIDLEELSNCASLEGFDWEDGIAP